MAKIWTKSQLRADSGIFSKRGINLWKSCGANVVELGTWSGTSFGAYACKI